MQYIVSITTMPCREPVWDWGIQSSRSVSIINSGVSARQFGYCLDRQSECCSTSQYKHRLTRVEVDKKREYSLYQPILQDRLAEDCTNTWIYIPILHDLRVIE
jgi:hypothetical protein